MDAAQPSWLAWLAWLARIDGVDGMEVLPLGRCVGLRYAALRYATLRYEQGKCTVSSEPNSRASLHVSRAELNSGATLSFTRSNSILNGRWFYFFNHKSADGMPRRFAKAL